MQKLYLDLPYTSDVPKAYQMDKAALSAATGANLGNLAFRHALRFVVKDMDSREKINFLELSQMVDADSSKKRDIVVSCANWLGLSERDESSNKNRADSIQKFDGNVVCFGLGVQAPITETLPKLGPNTLRLAKTLAEHATLLSVRDQLTQDTLEAEGILNTVVTGCPSNLINNDPQLGAKVSARAREIAGTASSWEDVRSCISEMSGGHPLSGQVLSQNLGLMDQTPAFYLIQSPLLLDLLIGDRKTVPPAYLSNHPFDKNQDKVIQVLRNKVLHFAHMDAWMDFARTCDISFGMRIHGTMVPMQSGVPSVLIAHDTRTIGLAEFMGIPWVQPSEFMEKAKNSPVALLERIAQTMDDYDARRANIANIFHDYVIKNGLVPDDHLLKLSPTPPQ